MFDQLNFLVEHVLIDSFGYTRQKVSEYVEFVRLEITMVLVSHLFACIWITIGTYDNGWVV